MSDTNGSYPIEGTEVLAELTGDDTIHALIDAMARAAAEHKVYIAFSITPVTEEVPEAEEVFSSDTMEEEEA